MNQQLLPWHPLSNPILPPEPQPPEPQPPGSQPLTPVRLGDLPQTPELPPGLYETLYTTQIPNLFPEPQTLVPLLPDPLPDDPEPLLPDDPEPLLPDDPDPLPDPLPDDPNFDPTPAPPSSPPDPGTG